MIEEVVQELVEIDKKSEGKGTGLAVVKYIAAFLFMGMTSYGTYLQSSMATKFEVLSEKLNNTNKELHENRMLLQKTVLDLHAVELAVKELQFNEKMKRTKK